MNLFYLINTTTQEEVAVIGKELYINNNFYIKLKNGFLLNLKNYIIEDQF